MGPNEERQSLRQIATHGFAWLGGQTVASKLVGLLSQYALSWFLLPEDFGLVGMATTVAAFVTVFTQIGLREFLVGRRRSELWVESALWLGLTLAVVGALFMTFMSPLAGWVYQEPRIATLILVLAIAQPLQAVITVMSSLLEKRMMFRALATIGTIMAVLGAALSVVLANLGFGAFSFVIPIPLVALLQAVAVWKVCGYRIKWRPRMRIWRCFVQTNSYMLFTNLCFMLGSYGVYLLLGAFQTTLAVGLYYFAFNLSVQVNRFLWASLGKVLLPLLSSIQLDQERLTKAFQNLVGAISVLVVPVSILQAALAEPIIKLFFAEKWQSAVPLVQLLSIGVGLHTIAEPCVPLLQAQRRFRELFIFTLIWTLLFLPTVFLAVKQGDLIRLATVIAGFYAVGSPIYYYFVTRTIGVTPKDVARAYLPPVCMSLVAATIAMLTYPMISVSPISALSIISIVFVTCYILLMSTMASSNWGRAMELVRSQMWNSRAR